MSVHDRLLWHRHLRLCHYSNHIEGVFGLRRHHTLTQTIQLGLNLCETTKILAFLVRGWLISTTVPFATVRVFPFRGYVYFFVTNARVPPCTAQLKLISQEHLYGNAP